MKLFSVVQLVGILATLHSVSLLPWEAEPKDEEWWFERHEEYLNTTRLYAGTNSSPRVIFFGDSITQDWSGYGSWVWGYKYEALPSLNYGIGGDQCQNVLWRILNDEVKGISPDLVVLKIGTNNIGGDTSDDVVRGIKAIVDALQSQLPSTKILLLGILPRSDNWPEIWPKIADVNIKISRLDNGGSIRFLDMWHSFAQGWVEVVPELYLPDMVHLDTPGYETWSRVMDPLFNQLLESSNSNLAFKSI